MSPQEVATERLTEDQRVERALLAALAELGGKRVEREALKFQGKELIIPATMDVDGAIDYLQEWRQSQEEEILFQRTFKYRPWDGAHALSSAMKKVFGTAGIQKPVWTFFGKRPPEMISIQTAIDKTEQVPWGEIYIPIFDGRMVIQGRKNKELGDLFHLSVYTAKKYAPHVEGLFTIVEDELAHYSIYRGKAIDGQAMPEFVDLRGVNPDKVIYSNEVEAQLEANLWSLIKFTKMQRKLDLPLKRANLLYGPYGTGKTLAGYRTAQIATEHGWTYIYCRPARDNLFDVMSTARLYQPCVVFVEDIDLLAAGEQSDPVEKLLDVMDGINAKGTEIMVVMTTNHADRIHRGMLRPGRLDSIIEIGDLDADGIARMIHSIVQDDMLAEEIDPEPIYEAMKGYLPAFVKESIDRAIRYAVVRGEGELLKLTTEDFVHAAKGLRPQWTMMTGAKEGTKLPTLDTALAEVVRQGATQVVDGARMVEEGDHIDDYRWVLAVPDENGGAR